MKMVLVAVAFLFVVQAQSVFAQSNDDFQHGENEPLLEGTIWADSENTKDFEMTYEFRAGGRMILKTQAHAGSRVNGTEIGKWSRKGNVVKMVFSSGGGFYEGKYYPQSQRIMVNWFDKNGVMGTDYTLVPFQGSSITSTPATPAPAQPSSSSSTTNIYVQPTTPAQSAPAAPRETTYTVFVYYLDEKNTKKSMPQVVSATSKSEAEREAERAWKRLHGVNNKLTFLEAVCN